MLELKNITVEVEGKTVLGNISMEIQDGEKFALFGPNGSGKTSLLMAIMGFSGYLVTTGSIVFNGTEINKLSTDERARLGIGLMFQRPPTLKGVRLRQMLDVVKSKGFNTQGEAAKFNMEGFLDREINAGFSGGELKRSELFQLLASSPTLALFDEPESGVDLENMELVGRMMNSILRTKDGNSALIITHTGYIFEYVEADRGCVLVGGQVHCFGNPRDILDTVREHGYEGCVACHRKRPKKSHNRK